VEPKLIHPSSWRLQEACLHVKLMDKFVELFGVYRSTTAYNAALIDIRLPDMEGIELLTRMKDTVLKVRKIIITGYPSMKNAIEAVNRKADAYILKPVEVEKLLDTVREQLKLQEAEKKYSEQKVAEFIETRVKELEALG
jgi:DNA-binding NtrC family response regulator